MVKPITESDLDEIEAEAKMNAAETYRGALLALVAEVRRLRRIVLDGASIESSDSDRWTGAPQPDP